MDRRLLLTGINRFNWIDNRLAPIGKNRIWAILTI